MLIFHQPRMNLLKYLKSFVSYNHSFSATLNFALLDLIFFDISSLEGFTNDPVFLNGTEKFPKKSFSTSLEKLPLLINLFTILSSKE